MTSMHVRGFAARCVLLGCLGLLLAVSPALATFPYVPVPFTPAILGPGLPPPSKVLGKEYSHDLDYMIAPPGVALDPEQIIAWDGSGGVDNGLDYTATRPMFTPDVDIDAIANHGDAFYNAIRSDDAHMIYSISRAATVKPFPAGGPPFATSPYAVPSAGPIPLAPPALGRVIGGAGEISYELATGFGAPPNVHGLWAPQAAINGMPLPEDIDGLEVWGPEPALTADSDKYSLKMDALSGVSVWNGSGSAYVGLPAIIGAVIANLGPLPTSVPNIQQLVDLDALMVRDFAGDPDDFGRETTPGGILLDEILFSIRQITNPFDPSGYYATGSEVMWLDASGATGFLHHGGHPWDKGYALSDMVALLPGATGGIVPVQLDLDALEAISSPEPTSMALLMLGLAAVAGVRRRK